MQAMRLNEWFAATVSAVFHCVLLVVTALIALPTADRPSTVVDIASVPVEEVEIIELEPVEIIESVDFHSTPERSPVSNLAPSIEAPVVDQVISISYPTMSTRAQGPTSEIAGVVAGDRAVGGGDGESGSGSGDGDGLVYDDSWAGMLNTLRRDGLDIVVVFDSTSSMGGEINTVKRQIGNIGRALLLLVPKTRISLVTYRDHGDAYLVLGVPLTNSIPVLERFLFQVQPGGGGDAPEAVHEGMHWAINRNVFHSKARKVVLVFGDAPPHEAALPVCMKMASDFSRLGGVVSTVTCRRAAPMPQFAAISKMGGGSAYVSRNADQLVAQTVVSFFGERYREEVIKFFANPAAYEAERRRRAAGDDGAQPRSEDVAAP